MMKLNYTFLLASALSIVFISSGFCMDKDENKSPPAASIPQAAAQKKTLPMVNTTFIVDGKNVPADLAYKYGKVDSKTTRLFFEGEVIEIDHATSSFESYVTGPALPCLIGRIYDPTRNKSLAFHKYALHGMKTFQPYYEKFGVKNPETLEVSLYSCALSEAQFAFHKKYYGGKTQAQEMVAVRNFLTEEFKIPKENIELRFFRNNLKLPELGIYQSAPLFVGITKNGELFHTSLIAEDVFDLEKVALPKDLKKYKTYSGLYSTAKINLCDAFTTCALCPTVRAHFVGDRATTDNSEYEQLSFFSSPQLDVPACSLPQMFELSFGTKGRVNFKLNPFQ